MARISKQEKERIRTKIVNVSERLFNELGYDETTTKQIAFDVGIAEGTVFNYFSTKEEIMFEVIYKEASSYEFSINPEVLKDQIVEELFRRIEKIMKVSFRIPKGMATSFVQVALKLAKKNPDKFRKMAELDFRMMAEIEDYLTILIEKNLIKEVNPKQFSEIVFGAIMFDFMMYFYMKEQTRKVTKQAIRQKLDILFSGYIKED